jgi:phage terminase large subunit-like protein
MSDSFLQQINTDTTAVASPADVQLLADMLDYEIYRRYEDDKLSFFVPHETQKRFLDSSARVKAFIGGNRSGKTTAGAVDMILECIGGHPLQKQGIRRKPPLFWRVVCVDFSNGIEKIILPICKEWLPKRYLINGDWNKSWLERSRTLTLTNGSKIEFMSASQGRDKFQGTSRDGLWVDEEISRDIWQECRMRLIDAGGRAVLTMTPLNGMTWVYDDIYLRSSDPDIDVITAVTADNPHINPAEIELIASGLSDEEQRVRLHGEFVSLHGLVYKEYTDRPPHVIESFTIPDDWCVYVGIDPHLRTETGVLFVACDRDNNLYVFDELFRGGLISDIAGSINTILNGRDYVTAVIDPASRQPNPVSGVSIRDEFARHGVITKNARKDVGAGIFRVREYLRPDPVYNKPKLFVFSTCRRLRYEFAHYVWDDATRTGSSDRQSPCKSDDHLLDCLRYIIMEEPAYISPVKRLFMHRDSLSRSGY